MQRERELKTKKKWMKPQLIVLVRGESEERVLVVCKATGWSGPLNSIVACGGGVCVACQIGGAS